MSRAFRCTRGRRTDRLFFLSFSLLQSFLLMFTWFLVGFLQEKGWDNPDRHKFFTPGFPFVVHWTYSLWSMVFNQPHHRGQMARTGFSWDYQSFFVGKESWWGNRCAWEREGKHPQDLWRGQEYFWSGWAVRQEDQSGFLFRLSSLPIPDLRCRHRVCFLLGI